LNRVTVTLMEQPLGEMELSGGQVWLNTQAASVWLAQLLPESATLVYNNCECKRNCRGAGDDNLPDQICVGCFQKDPGAIRRKPDRRVCTRHIHAPRKRCRSSHWWNCRRGCPLFHASHTWIHFLLYAGIGVTTCVVVGDLASLLVPGCQQPLNSLEIFTLRKR